MQFLLKKKLTDDLMNHTHLDGHVVQTKGALAEFIWGMEHRHSLGRFLVNDPVPEGFEGYAEPIRHYRELLDLMLMAGRESMKQGEVA